MQIQHCGTPTDAVRPRTPITGPRPSHQLALFAVLAAALVARAVSFNGYAGSDDASYAELAHSLAHGTFRPGEYLGPPVFPLRVGVFAPVALLFAHFGTSEITLLVYPMFLSLLSVGLAYWSACLLVSPRAGLIAAAILAVLPLASRSATLLTADLPGAVWGNLGILLLIAGLRRPSDRQRWMWAGAAGLTLGASWLCKESVIYLLPFTAAYAAWAGGAGWRRVAAPAAVLAGFGVVLATEAAVYAAALGDLAHRFHEIHRNYDYSRTWFFAEGTRFGWSAGEYQAALLRRLFREGPLTLFASPTFGGVTAAAVPGIVLALRWRHPGLLVASAWFVSLALMFNFASASLTQYQPLVLFDKYLYPVLFPAVLLLAGLLDQLLVRAGEEPAVRTARLIQAGSMAALVGGGCLLGTARNVVAGPKNRAERRLAQLIPPETPLYTDRRTLRILEFFWGYPKVTGGRDFQGMTPEAVPPGSRVLINPDKLRFLQGNYDYLVPSFCEQVPPRWELAHASGRAALYRTPAMAGERHSIRLARRTEEGRLGAAVGSAPGVWLASRGGAGP